MKKAVVLLSGGLDSTICLALAREQGFMLYALSFDYGQGHIAELTAARKIAAHCKVAEHKIVDLHLHLGGSALTDKNIKVPDHVDNKQIPITYVPARNTIFLSIALAYAESIGATDIFFGGNADDYHGYPDCRPEYMQAFERVANLATKAGVEGQALHLHTPLINLSKADIIREGVRLGVDFSQTISCYRADEHGKACGNCGSCVIRANGFAAAGVVDTAK